MLLYFISFLLIVSFFVLNMFVGVVVENFHKCRQHQEAEEARRREEKRQRRLERKRRSKALPVAAVAGRYQRVSGCFTRASPVPVGSGPAERRPPGPGLPPTPGWRAPGQDLCLPAPPRWPCVLPVVPGPAQGLGASRGGAGAGEAAWQEVGVPFQAPQAVNETPDFHHPSL